ncbi:MAG: hypothetical protein ACK5V3_09495 [Bdellovibrionales bacterium]
MKTLLFLLLIVQLSLAQTFITDEESLPPGVKKLIDFYQLYESHSLYTSGGSEKIKMATDRKVDPLYLPENRLKFPLPYYLIPQAEVDFISAESLSPQILEQLRSTIEGKDFYKLFVHPKSEKYYQFLKEKNYTYVSVNSTEFTATATTSLRSLVV